VKCLPGGLPAMTADERVKVMAERAREQLEVEAAFADEVEWPDLVCFFFQSCEHWDFPILFPFLICHNLFVSIPKTNNECLVPLETLDSKIFTGQR
jgi:hypothetical protein